MTKPDNLINMQNTALVRAAAPVLARAGTTKALPAPISLAELMAGCRRMVIVAAHPGDETLGMGGAVAMWLQQGGSLAVIAVTDGDAAPLASGSWWTPARLRCIRPAESALALRHLGWPQKSAIKRLHVPHGKVADHEQLLANYLRRWLRSDDHILTAWGQDGPADNAATSRAVAAAADTIGCGVAEFPFWHRNRFLLGNSATSRPVRHLQIDTDALWRKRKALTAYRSQLDADPRSGAPPELPEHVLRPCLQAVEMLLV